MFISSIQTDFNGAGPSFLASGNLKAYQCILSLNHCDMRQVSNTNRDDNQKSAVPFFAVRLCTTDSRNPSASPPEPECEVQDRGSAKTRLQSLSQRKRSFAPLFLPRGNWEEELSAAGSVARCLLDYSGYEGEIAGSTIKSQPITPGTQGQRRRDRCITSFSLRLRARFSA